MFISPTRFLRTNRIARFEQKMVSESGDYLIGLPPTRTENAFGFVRVFTLNRKNSAFEAKMTKLENLIFI